MRTKLPITLAFLAASSLTIQAPAESNPCLIVKHKGTVGRRLIWFALIAVPIAPGSKYDYVDSIDYESRRMKYGAKDLQKVQDSGVHVIILNKNFASDDLKAARASCSGRAARTEVKGLGLSGYPDAAGFRVTSVAPKGVAESTHIHPGDVMTKIDGRDVRTAAEIEAAIAASAGPSVKISLLVQTVSMGVVGAEREAKIH
jgi:membrane-associated protease RseP (regulator of RpoE activity)